MNTNFYNLLLDGEMSEESVAKLSKALSQNWPEIVIRVGGAILAYIVGTLIIKAVAKGIKKAAIKKNSTSKARKIIGIISNVGLYIVLAVVELAILGIPVSSVLYVFLALVIAIVIALKDYINILACGVVIFVTAPYKIGDQVEIANGVIGNVSDFTLLATKILTPDNKIIYVPNNKITTNTISNFSEKGMRLANIKIGIGYDTDMYQAKELFKKILNESIYHIEGYDGEVSVSKLQRSNVELQGKMMVKCDVYNDVEPYILEQVKVQFEQAGIKLTYS